ncbi:MAG: tripartite tricarboxylate transporter permease [Deltaproteobacteria bacterium]|nr:tripartite tricarboxylate transporter permease [Deltaproteobacteria bacterium]
METLGQLLYGFGVALQPDNLLFCGVGVLMGTLVGILPGLGPAGGIALLLPISFYMTPTSAIILLAGVFYGSMYGGSTTSILLNIPGEAASVVTVLDGYEMAKRGRAGPALGIAAFGSFIAGTLGLLGLVFLAPALARFALRFGAPEYFSLLLLAFSLLSYLSSGSMIKSLMMSAVGLLLGTVGTDPQSGYYRYTFGTDYLMDGFGMVPVIMGLFGVAEVLQNLESREKSDVLSEKISKLLPSRKDWAASIWSILRGTVVGFFIGMLPGGNPVIASFSSYTIEKKLSKHPERFGKGAIEGVAGPEAANNCASSAAFIPLLTIGIPVSPVTALLLGALMIHGVIPGAGMISQRPDVFWGVISSMYMGNVLLLILNLPLIGLWIRILRVPYSYLFPAVLCACLIGVYSIRNSVMDLLVMVGFGLGGYLMRKADYEPAPLILGLILGPIMEEHFRRSLNLYEGNLLLFFTRPISAVFLITTLLVFTVPLIRQWMGHGHTKSERVKSNE